MKKPNYPSCYELPVNLTIMAVDESGNERPVTYYRADTLLASPRTIEDIFYFQGCKEENK